MVCLTSANNDSFPHFFSQSDLILSRTELAKVFVLNSFIAKLARSVTQRSMLRSISSGVVQICISSSLVDDVQLSQLATSDSNFNLELSSCIAVCKRLVRVFITSFGVGPTLSDCFIGMSVRLSTRSKLSMRQLSVPSHCLYSGVSESSLQVSDDRLTGSGVCVEHPVTKKATTNQSMPRNLFNYSPHCQRSRFTQRRLPQPAARLDYLECI